jgi:hypothetical protein
LPVATAILASTSLHGVDLVRLGRALAGGDTQRSAGEAVMLARAASFVRGVISATPRAVRGELARRGCSPRCSATSRPCELASHGEPALALA